MKWLFLFLSLLFPFTSQSDEFTEKTLSKSAQSALNRLFVEANQVNASKDHSKWWAKISLVEPGVIGERSYFEPALGTNSELILHLRLDRATLENPLKMAEILAQYQYFRDIGDQLNKNFKDLRQWAETFWNAESGDIGAIAELKSAERNALELSEKDLKKIYREVKFGRRYPEFLAALDARKLALDQEIFQLDKQNRIWKKEAEKKWLAGEAERVKREKAATKLDELVKRNDRKGVRELLEVFLPWDSMGSVEKRAWKQWLEAIENPKTSTEDTVVAFRGLDRDSKARLTSDGTPTFMAPMLVRNQGNYTRRLRSYRISRERIGSIHGMMPESPDSTYSKYPTLLGGMRYHSNDPMGTPYISFSNFSIANNWSDEGIVAVRVDKRRMVPNNISSYFELERLVPLIVFPDEVLAYREFPPQESIDKIVESFREEVEKKLGRSLTAFEDGKGGFSTFEATRVFRDEGLKDFVEQYVEPDVKVDRYELSNEKYGQKPHAINVDKLLENCNNFFSTIENPI